MSKQPPVCKGGRFGGRQSGRKCGDVDESMSEHGTYTTQNNSYVLFPGIKGLVLTRMLLSFERLFGSPIIHNFDWLVGTSTGGILALALATGKTAIE